MDCLGYQLMVLDIEQSVDYFLCVWKKWLGRSSRINLLKRGFHSFKKLKYFVVKANAIYIEKLFQFSQKYT